MSSRTSKACYKSSAPTPPTPPSNITKFWESRPIPIRNSYMDLIDISRTTSPLAPTPTRLHASIDTNSTDDDDVFLSVHSKVHLGIELNTSLKHFHWAIKTAPDICNSTAGVKRRASFC
ncbi:hypothetical protein P9112_004825 [Eukaryota sp. TZLM1-RC]